MSTGEVANKRPSFTLGSRARTPEERKKIKMLESEYLWVQPAYKVFLKYIVFFCSPCILTKCWILNKDFFVTIRLIIMTRTNRFPLTNLHYFLHIYFASLLWQNKPSACLANQTKAHIKYYTTRTSFFPINEFFLNEQKVTSLVTAAVRTTLISSQNY